MINVPNENCYILKTIIFTVEIHLNLFLMTHYLFDIMPTFCYDGIDQYLKMLSSPCGQYTQRGIFFIG